MASTSRAPHQRIAATRVVRHASGCMTVTCTQESVDRVLLPAIAPPLAIPCHLTCYSVAIPGGEPRGMEGNAGASATASFSLARRCFRRFQRDVARIGHSLLVNSSPLHPAFDPANPWSCGVFVSGLAGLVSCTLPPRSIVVSWRWALSLTMYEGAVAIPKGGQAHPAYAPRRHQRRGHLP